MVNDGNSVIVFTSLNLMVALLLFQMITPLVNISLDLNKKLVAYSICSEKMIDQSFMGEPVNFTECYLNEIENAKLPKCVNTSSEIICEYDNKQFVYKIR